MSIFSYIKPQQTNKAKLCGWAVCLSFPTSNHNSKTIQILAVFAVCLSFPTSNHNAKTR